MKQIGLFKIENVANLGNIGGAKLALDSAGNPHISCQDRANNIKNLVYAHKVGSNWLSETVDGADVGWHNSIAVDSSGKPHIAYTGTNGVKYAYKDGSGWHIQNVSGGWAPFLVLDSEDNPHIIFQDGDNGLVYAHKDGSSWDVQIVDNSKGRMNGHWSSLTLDSAGNPHISYFDIVNENLEYAHWNGSSWDVQIVDSSSAGWCSSIEVDAAGNPHIAYFWWNDNITADQNIRYASWNGSSWDIKIVDDLGKPFTSLELDAFGNPHISYLINDAQGPFARYARWNGSSWELKNLHNKQTADVFDMVLKSSRIPCILLKTIDNYGQPHLAYASFVSSTTLSSSFNVKNYGISPVHIEYKLEITKPNGKVTTKVLDQDLAAGESAYFYLGKYGVNTKIRVCEYINQKFQIPCPVHISNMFALGGVGSYTYDIHQQNAKPSLNIKKNAIYAEKEILITDTGLKVNVLKPHAKK